MAESAWKRTTWAGNRRAQHEDFMRLSFREKLLELERMSEVAGAIGHRSAARTSDTRADPAKPKDE